MKRSSLLIAEMLILCIMLYLLAIEQNILNFLWIECIFKGELGNLKKIN